MTAKRAGKPQKAPPALSPSDVLIVSYDRLRGDASLQKISWAMLILDEAHVIRNPATLTAQRVFSLRSQSRLALTGTPVQNHVEEVWSLMNFLLPDYLAGDFPTFRSAVVRPIQRSLLVQAEVASGVPGQSDKLKFGRSIAISAEGLGVLRRLHKQVRALSPHRACATV
ncbi:SNF2 family N-terminal domain-containing protein [Ochromonadaceae sp. CCMP2298]|nr:SNF2 family N-terminal domain-containing protein [Ochromonadaceae sp. CCMP2298]